MFRRAFASGLTLTLCLCALAPAAHAGRAEKEAIELYKKGIELGNKGDFEKAIEAFRTAVEKAPKFDSAYLKLGLAYEMTHRWPEALAAYDMAIEVDRKKKPYAHSQLGDLYRKMGLPQLAVQAYQEAVVRAKRARKPKRLVSAYEDLAEAYYDMKDYDKAAKTARDALKAAPDNPDARLLLGNALLLQDKLVEAEEQYQKILEKEADNADALFAMGVLARKRDKGDEAKDYFTKACKKGHKKACDEKKPRYVPLR